MIISEWGRRIYYQKKDCIQLMKVDGTLIWICPKCKDHIQRDTMMFHDCKELIYKDELVDGKLDIFGQCMCYAEEHGIRS